MNRGSTILIAAGLGAIIALPVAADEYFSPALQATVVPPPAGLQLRGERAEWRGRGIGGYASARVTGTVMYGADHRQQIDLYVPDEAMGDAPLIMYIRGGGWSAGNHKMVGAKAVHFAAQGFVFASAGYRVLPDAPVEQQAADLGAGLRALRAQAEDHGFDPDAIVLIGHSAGAHLAALLASDPQYAGDAFDAIRGVVLVDGGGYDISLALTMLEMEAPLIYRDVFGTDGARHKALSPISHIGGKDAPNWLILHLADRAATTRQAAVFSAALRKAGRTAEVIPVEGSNHSAINREIGTEQGAAQTQAIDTFLDRVFGR